MADAHAQGAHARTDMLAARRDGGRASFERVSRSEARLPETVEVGDAYDRIMSQRTYGKRISSALTLAIW